MVNPACTASEHSTAHAIKTLKNTNVLHLWWSISPWVDQVSGPSLDRRLCQNQLHQNLTLGCQSHEPSTLSTTAQHECIAVAQAIQTLKYSNVLHLWLRIAHWITTYPNQTDRRLLNQSLTLIACSDTASYQGLVQISGIPNEICSVIDAKHWYFST